MLGETITVTLDGAGGTPVVLNKINQDAFSSVYLKKQSDNEIRLTIRHTKDNVKAGTQPFDRHNVLLEQTYYPTAAKPLGCVYQVSLTIRNDPSCDETVLTNLGEALAMFASDVNLTKLYGWES